MKYFIIGSIVQHNIFTKTCSSELLLLGAIPFEVLMEVWIDGRCRDCFFLLKRNEAIPARHVETIMDENSNIIIQFLGKRFYIDVKKYFQYHPKSYNISLDINVGYFLKFEMKDCETGKEITIDVFELLDSEFVGDA